MIAVTARQGELRNNLSEGLVRADQLGVSSLTFGREGDSVFENKPKHVVLCIGNDLVNLNLRCFLLSERGWQVLSSGSGHEGAIRFGQQRVDAVVLDLNGDGSEAALIASELKRRRPSVPVVMLVADRKVLAEGATDQAAAVLLKAQESRRLHPTLARLLNDS